MDAIFKLTARTLRLNRKRTILTILTIMLSVGMMTAVLCGGWSMLKFLREKEAAYGGDYEYSIEVSSLSQAKDLLDGENVEDVSLFSDVGSSFYGEPSNKTLLAIAGIDSAFVKNFFLEQYLEDGKFPESEDEIVLTNEFIEDNGLEIAVGDTIELSLGTRVWNETGYEFAGLVNYLGGKESFRFSEDKTFTVVGIVSPMNDSYIARDLNALTGISEQDTITAFVKCEEIKSSVYTEAEENAAKVQGEVLSCHSDLLAYYGVTGGNGARKILILVAMAIVLLMVAASAMIGNVLSISLQERIRQLGMLASIGATKKQRSASVRMEASLLGIIGIPLGLLFGTILTAVSLSIIRTSFESTFSFGIIRLHLVMHGLILLLGVFTGVISLILACRVPSREARKVSVIDTLKGSNIYAAKAKVRGRLMSLLFGIYGALAGKNIHRNPKRFRAVTMSVFLAVVIGGSVQIEDIVIK